MLLDPPWNMEQQKLYISAICNAECNAFIYDTIGLSPIQKTGLTPILIIMSTGYDY